MAPASTRRTQASTCAAHCAPNPSPDLTLTLAFTPIPTPTLTLTLTLNPTLTLALTRTRCDLHLLDTTTLAWSQPQVHGPSPQERRYHTAVVIDKRIFIFGGQYYDPQARRDEYIG